MTRITEIVREKVYTVDGKIAKDRCAARAQGVEGKRTYFYQCTRRVKKEIGGYGWCTQHAKEIKSAAGELPETVFYISGVNYNNPYVVEVRHDGVKYKTKALYGGNRYFSRAEIDRHKSFAKAKAAVQNAVDRAREQAAALREDAREVDGHIAVLQDLVDAANDQGE